MNNYFQKNINKEKKKENKSVFIIHSNGDGVIWMQIFKVDKIIINSLKSMKI